MNRRHITLICSSYPPETGAAPGRMVHLAKVLKQNGYTVQVICAMPNYPTGKIFSAYRGKFRVKETIDGIEILRLWMIPTHASHKLKRTISILSYSLTLFLMGLPTLLRGKPGIVLVSSPPFATGYIGTWMAKMVRARVVLNISDLWPQTARDLGFIGDGFLYRFLLKCEVTMYRRADACTVQSEYIGHHICAKGIDKPLFVYRNLQPIVAHAIQPRPAGNRKIVYTGLLGIAQGVLDIVRHIDFAACGTELHIYGQGRELPAIQEYIHAHPGTGVYYQGSVPASDIPSILAGYHAMLVPLSTGIAGAVPSKIFLAVANGLPILYCGEGEAATIVSAQHIGFVSRPGRAEELKKNIMMLCGMEESEYRQLRQNCLDCSEQVFNTAKQDEAFVDFLGGI